MELTSEGVVRLDDTEARIVSLAADGCTDAEISESLKVEMGAVEAFWGEVALKLSTTSRFHSVLRLAGLRTVGKLQFRAE